jgi:hypothetical protein
MCQAQCQLAIVNKGLVGVFVICLQIRTHVPSSSGLLVTAIRLRATYRTRAVALLFSLLNDALSTTIRRTGRVDELERTGNEGVVAYSEVVYQNSSGLAKVSHENSQSSQCS